MLHKAIDNISLILPPSAAKLRRGVNACVTEKAKPPPKKVAWSDEKGSQPKKKKCIYNNRGNAREG